MKLPWGRMSLTGLNGRVRLCGAGGRASCQRPPLEAMSTARGGEIDIGASRLLIAGSHHLDDRAFGRLAAETVALVRGRDVRIVLFGEWIGRVPFGPMSVFHSESGVSRRTLERLLARAGLPHARDLTMAARVALAHDLVSDGARSSDPRWDHFGISRRAIAAWTRRHLRVSLKSLGSDFTVPALAASLRRAIRRHCGLVDSYPARCRIAEVNVRRAVSS